METGSLAFGKMQIAAAVSVFLATFLAALLFVQTGIVANDFVTFKFEIVAAKVLSIETLVFLLALPLPIAITTAFAKRMEKAKLALASIAPTIIATGLALLAFPGLQELWAIAIFYIISLPLAIETAFAKYSELKKWIGLRTALATTGKMVSLLSIGIFVFTAITIMPQQEQYIEKFEDFVLDIAQGFTTGRPQQAISSEAVDLMVNTQSATVDSILDNPLFAKLREKTDPDVVAFVAASDLVKEQVRGPEFRAQIEQNIGQASGNAIREIDILNVLKKEFPFFEMVESLLWALHGLAIAGMFSLAAGIICKPMSVAYVLVSEKILSTFDKSQETGPPANA